MPRIVDDEPPIKTHPASDEYRENWDRIFGDGPQEIADDEDDSVCALCESFHDEDEYEDDEEETP